MTDDYGDIIHRVLLDLEEEDATPKSAPRCDGCGWHVGLVSYQRRTTHGGTETVC
jgi:hypothetical protein